MKKLIYSLFDKKLQQYMSPIVVDHEGQVVRSLQDAVTNKAQPNDINMHSADFDLYKVATFDTESGIMEPETPKPLFIVNAALFEMKGNKHERNAEQASQQ